MPISLIQSSYSIYVWYIGTCKYIPLLLRNNRAKCGAYNPSTWRGGARGWRVHGRPHLHGNSDASLSCYMRPCQLKKKEQTVKQKGMWRAKNSDKQTYGHLQITLITTQHWWPMTLSRTKLSPLLFPSVRLGPFKIWGFKFDDNYSISKVRVGP